jgi:hypothetical protein
MGSVILQHQDTRPTYLLLPDAAELTMDELKFAAAVLNPEIMVHAPRSDAGGQCLRVQPVLAQIAKAHRRL